MEPTNRDLMLAMTDNCCHVVKNRSFSTGAAIPLNQPSHLALGKSEQLHTRSLATFLVQIGTVTLKHVIPSSKLQNHQDWIQSKRETSTSSILIITSV